MIYILYKLNLKLKLSYLTAILICGRFCNKVVSKIVFSWKIISIRFIFLNRMKSGLFVVQLSRTDYQDKDNGQHTGSVIPRFVHSSWGTLDLPFISFIACIKIQKQIWFISIIIANKTGFQWGCWGCWGGGGRVRVVNCPKITVWAMWWFE